MLCVLWSSNVVSVLAESIDDVARLTELNSKVCSVMVSTLYSLSLP